MEVKNGDKFTKTVLLAEFLGTCGLMLVYNMSDGSTAPAFTLYIMMMLTLGISGGHLNPAVTLGVFIERREFSRDLPYLLLFLLV